MIDVAEFERFALSSGRPRYAIVGVECDGGGDVLDLSEGAGERARILDCLGRTLRQERNHRVRRVAYERNTSDRERRNRWTAIEWPTPPLIWRVY